MFHAVSATMAIKRRPFSRLLRHAGDTEDVFSTWTPGVLTGEQSEKETSQIVTVWNTYVENNQYIHSKTIFLEQYT